MSLSGVAGQLLKVARDPRRLRRLHYSNVLSTAHLLFEPDDYGFLHAVFSISGEDFRELERELVGDWEFRVTIERRYHEGRGVPLTLLGPTSAADDNPRNRLLYYCTRLVRPDVVLETGVLDGVSSAFILKALRDNGRGRLCSIDLPAHQAVTASTDKMAFATLPPGHAPGWLIADALRDRWTLRVGSSRDLLQPWLADLGAIDVFYHDSLHTYANMVWEYALAWSYLVEGGLLLSDDVFWSPAFWVFRRRVGARACIARGMGLARKGGSEGDTPFSVVKPNSVAF